MCAEILGILLLATWGQDWKPKSQDCRLPPTPTPLRSQDGQVPGTPEAVRKKKQRKNPVCAEPSPGKAMGGWGGSYTHPPFMSLTPCVWKNSPSHSRSQILPSTRKGGSSGGFQSISRRLRGSFPQNHIHTLCLPCSQRLTFKKNQHHETELLLQMGFKGQLCKIFTLPRLSRIKRAASHRAERKQAEPGKETSRVQWAGLSLPHINPH